MSFLQSYPVESITSSPISFKFVLFECSFPVGWTDHTVLLKIESIRVLFIISFDSLL